MNHCHEDSRANGIRDLLGLMQETARDGQAVIEGSDTGLTRITLWAPCRAHVDLDFPSADPLVVSQQAIVDVVTRGATLYSVLLRVAGDEGGPELVTRLLGYWMDGVAPERGRHAIARGRRERESRVASRPAPAVRSLRGLALPSRVGVRARRNLRNRPYGSASATASGEEPMIPQRVGGPDLRLIEELVARESSIQDIGLNGKSFDVEFDRENGSITLTVAKPAVRMRGVLTRPLVHQLARRVLPDQRVEIESRVENLEASRRWFEKKLTVDAVHGVLDRPSVVVRALPTDDEAILYGIVSDTFQRTNQLEVREQLLEEAPRTFGRVLESRGIAHDWTGALMESFEVESGEHFESGLVVRYGLDNGYSAYKVLRSAMVLVCRNGLRARRLTGRSWFHNDGLPLEAFLRKGLDELTSAQGMLTAQRERSLATPLDSDRLRELVARMNVAWQSSLRILDRLTTERATAGTTDWALSQAMTWLGTHERALAQPRAFTSVGTNVLTDGLAATLARPGADDESPVRSRGDLLNRPEARKRYRELPRRFRAELDSRLRRIAK